MLSAPIGAAAWLQVWVNASLEPVLLYVVCPCPRCQCRAASHVLQAARVQGLCPVLLLSAAPTDASLVLCQCQSHPESLCQLPHASHCCPRGRCSRPPARSAAILLLLQSPVPGCPLPAVPQQTPCTSIRSGRAAACHSAGRRSGDLAEVAEAARGRDAVGTRRGRGEGLGARGRAGSSSPVLQGDGLMLSSQDKCVEQGWAARSNLLCVPCHQAYRVPVTKSWLQGLGPVPAREREG